MLPNIVTYNPQHFIIVAPQILPYILLTLLLDLEATGLTTEVPR